REDRRRARGDDQGHRPHARLQGAHRDEGRLALRPLPDERALRHPGGRPHRRALRPMRPGHGGLAAADGQGRQAPHDPRDPNVRVAAVLAPRSNRVASFIDNAARVTKQTGDHQTELAEAVRRLPGLLDATRPALHRLDTLAADGTPVLSDLRASAPDLTRLVRRLTPFSRYGVP